MKRKQKSILFSEEKRRNAQANIRQFEWAQKQAETTLQRADIWANRSDDELWEFVPGHTLHRYIHVSPDKGCPSCGTDALKFGAYEWATDPHTMPWKVVCPNCNEVFPKNDFGCYYRSGLDGKGIFRPDLADRSLLFHEEHPEPDDPLHKFAVDDGFGWDGFTFIPYYAHWGLWASLAFVGNERHFSILKDLSQAYCFTGNELYAHKAAVLLDRLADVYGEMDFFDQGDHGNEASGGIFDSVWEAMLFTTLANAYDAIFDGIVNDENLVSFLREKSSSIGLDNPKSCFDEVQANIEDNLLREGKRRIMVGDIWANATIHHETFIRLVVVLDDDNRDSDLEQVLFETMPILPRGKLDYDETVKGIVERSLKEDGSGYESINYHTCFDSLRTVANVLRGDQRYDVYRLFPEFEKFFEFYIDAICIERYYPHIGDSWNTGGPSFPATTHFLRFPTVEGYIDAFREYRNPRFAQFISFLCDGDLERVHGDIFDESPESLRHEIAEAVRKHGPLTWTSRDFSGFGLVVLRSGENDNQRAAWLSYAAPPTHGHRDKLSIGLFAHGLNMMPDLGYPEYTGGGGPMADKRRHAWTSNTISHNSIIVDQRGQKRDAGGTAQMFADSAFAKIAIANGPDNYDATTVYERTLLMIDIDDKDFYVVDIFRVHGGNDHVYSFHATEGDVETEGLHLTRRPGTFAGTDVPYSELKMEGTNAWKFPDEPRSGYDFLYNIEQDTSPSDSWSVEWAIKDTWNVLDRECDVRLKLTMLSSVDDVVLADGDPPQVGKGNARRLKYVLAHRAGTDLESCFVSVIEPFRGESRIRSITRRDLAISVTRDDGLTDRIQFDGALSIVTEDRNGKAVRAARCNNE